MLNYWRKNLSYCINDLWWGIGDFFFESVKINCRFYKKWLGLIINLYGEDIVFIFWWFLKIRMVRRIYDYNLWISFKNWCRVYCGVNGWYFNDVWFVEGFCCVKYGCGWNGLSEWFFLKLFFFEIYF